MAFFVGKAVAGYDPTDVHTEALNALGTEVDDNSGNRYIYLKGATSMVAGDLVTFDSTFTAVRATTTGPTRGSVAVAMAAVDAATKWGWFLIKGAYATANVATHSSGSGLGLFLSATTGRATSTPATEMSLMGMWTTGNSASNVGPVYLNNPRVVGDIST